MTIREMTIDDIAYVAEMEARDSGNAWDQTGLFTYMVREDAILLVADLKDSPADSEDSLADHEDSLTDCRETEPEIIGFAGILMAPPDSDILDITIDRDHRNRKIGTALFGELLKRAEERGVRTVFLEVRISNEPAKRLYEKYGFKEIGYRKNYYSDPVEDAYVMSRESE